MDHFYSQSNISSDEMDEMDKAEPKRPRIEKIPGSFTFQLDIPNNNSSSSSRKKIPPQDLSSAWPPGSFTFQLDMPNNNSSSSSGKKTPPEDPSWQSLSAWRPVLSTPDMQSKLKRKEKLMKISEDTQSIKKAIRKQAALVEGLTPEERHNKRTRLQLAKLCRLGDHTNTGELARRALALINELEGERDYYRELDQFAEDHSNKILHRLQRQTRHYQERYYELQKLNRLHDTAVASSASTTTSTTPTTPPTPTTPTTTTDDDYVFL